MPSWVAWLIAAVSTTAFLVLWFWEVRRVLRSRRSVVESAAAQLSACRRQAAGVRYDPESSRAARASTGRPLCTTTIRFASRGAVCPAICLASTATPERMTSDRRAAERSHAKRK